MSGLLQRLAGQALGANVRGANIRSAASVHAQVPVMLPVAGGAPALDVPAIPAARASMTSRESQGAPAPSISETDMGVAEKIGDPTSSTSDPARPDEGIRTLHIREHERREVIRELAAPAALLPVSASPTIESPAIAPASVPVRAESRSMDAGSKGTTTEVHVHIGRIEVVAATEPATPKKARAIPARQTRSLGDYLSGAKRA